MAVLIPICLAACGPTDIARVQAAGQAVGEARAAQMLPDLPPDCRRHTRSGVRQGDRLDIALLQTDAALAAQNARTTRCATWYDTLREGFASNETPPGPS